MVLWYAGSERTLKGFLPISVPVLVLMYMAAVAGVSGWGNPPRDAEGSPANVFGPHLGVILSLAAFGWLEFVSIAVGWWGNMELATFCAVIGLVFLIATFPGRLSWARIIAATVGLVVASILFVLHG